MYETFSSRFKRNTGTVLLELRDVLVNISPEDLEKFIVELNTAEKIFFVGVGRVKLSLEAIAKRLSHLGYDTHMVGDMNEPAITEKDLLIVGSGSGNTVVPVAIAKRAKELRATVLHLGSNKDGAVSKYVDVFVRIPANTKYKKEGEVESKQPMTSLFEQSLLLFGDIVVMSILNGEDIEGLWECHANLE